jgi:hypothetical protein
MGWGRKAVRVIQALLTLGKPDIEGRKWEYEERMLAVQNLAQAGPKQVGLIQLLWLLWLPEITRL